MLQVSITIFWGKMDRNCTFKTLDDGNSFSQRADLDKAMTRLRSASLLHHIRCCWEPECKIKLHSLCIPETQSWKPETRKRVIAAKVDHRLMMWSEGGPFLLARQDVASYRWAETKWPDNGSEQYTTVFSTRLHHPSLFLRPISPKSSMVALSFH